MNDWMRRVMQDGFMVTELGLYLDTHPGCECGLAAFREAQERYAASRAAYEQNCGPLTQDAAEAEGCWDWIQRPWPWEMEG